MSYNCSCQTLIFGGIQAYIIVDTINVIKETDCSIFAQIWPLISYTLFFISRLYEVIALDNVFSRNSAQIFYFGFLFTANLLCTIVGTVLLIQRSTGPCLAGHYYMFIFVYGLSLVRNFMFLCIGVRYCFFGLLYISLFQAIFFSQERERALQRLRGSEGRRIPLINWDDERNVEREVADTLGMSQEELSQIKQRSLSRKECETLELCVICQINYKKGERVRELPHCKHVYHQRCIDKWLQRKATCPNCNNAIRNSLRI